RAGEANLKGSFAKVDGEEIVLHNMHISPYEFSRDEQDPLRPRKLLLHRSEIRAIITKIAQRGYTLVPLKVYFRRGYAKVEIGLARGKKQYDKRASLKEKQVRREVDREVRSRR
ncbi:MAG: SsrA-binding protein SmpB, partial [Candidatus Omnitrophica bacterium]|nr:SsrA-binding protein SmpB [Candidatus Omnitrophota bacterium]